MGLSNIRIKWFYGFVFLIILSIIGGCGVYSFSGSSIPPHIKTVAVPLFEDNTAELGIDQQLTDAVIDAITRDNTLKIAGPRAGDSVVRGTILRVEDRAGQYDENENASDFRVTLNVKVVFEDVKNRNALWEETFSQWGAYDNSETSREDGIQEAIDKIVTDVLNRMVSGW
jgi:hypothetical protein